MEAMEQQKKEKEAEKAAAAAAPTSTAVPYTPDYAAGLVSPAPAVSVHINSHQHRCILHFQLSCRSCLASPRHMYAVIA